MFKIIKVTMTEKGTLSNNGFSQAEQEEYVLKNREYMDSRQDVFAAARYLISRDMARPIGTTEFVDIFLLDTVDNAVYEYDDPDWGVFPSETKLSPDCFS